MATVKEAFTGQPEGKTAAVIAKDGTGYVGEVASYWNEGGPSPVEEQITLSSAEVYESPEGLNDLIDDQAEPDREEDDVTLVNYIAKSKAPGNHIQELEEVGEEVLTP